MRFPLYEIWKDIPEWEGIYQVSNYGRIKRVAGSPHTKKERILKPYWTGQGRYAKVTLMANGRRVQRQVHRLVMLAFVGDHPFEVDHDDDDKWNNALWNLEYTTHQENVRRAAQAGLLPRGEQHPHAKLTATQVMEIYMHLRKGFYTHKHLAKMYGVTPGTIAVISQGRTWKHIPKPPPPILPEQLPLEGF